MALVYYRTETPFYLDGVYYNGAPSRPVFFALDESVTPNAEWVVVSGLPSFPTEAQLSPRRLIARGRIDANITTAQYLTFYVPLNDYIVREVIVTQANQTIDTPVLVVKSEESGGDQQIGTVTFSGANLLAGREFLDITTTLTKSLTGQTIKATITTPQTGLLDVLVFGDVLA